MGMIPPILASRDGVHNGTPGPGPIPVPGQIGDGPGRGGRGMGSRSLGIGVSLSHGGLDPPRATSPLSGHQFMVAPFQECHAARPPRRGVTR